MEPKSAWKEVTEFIIWAFFSNAKTAIPTITGIVIFIISIIAIIIINKSPKGSGRIKEKRKHKANKKIK